jgi:hypothetical protein
MTLREQLKSVSSKFVRLILYFVAIGLVLAMILYLLWSVPTVGGRIGAQDNALMTILSFLCPGTLVFLMCIDCEIGSSPGLFFFLIIAGVNVFAYGAIGAIVAALLTQHPPEKR